MKRQANLVISLLLLICACGGSDTEEVASSERDATLGAQDAFWESLSSLCGSSYQGTVTESHPPDTSFSNQIMVMHVRGCDSSVIRIPFHVGENRSRTWVLTRSENSLSLKHDHRHEDGTEDEVTMYGGDTQDQGSGRQQEFPADAHTGDMLPASATNIWTLEIVPDRLFVYDLRRTADDRRVRIEFDLTRPIPAPPPPWGG